MQGIVRNLDVRILQANPAAPVVAPGAPGAQTWGYKVVDYFADGRHTTGSAEGTTAAGPLDITAPGAQNTVTPPAAPAGLVERRFYRTTAPGGGTPNTTGLIATVAGGAAANPLIDNGLVAGAETPATVNTTGDGDALNVKDWMTQFSAELSGGGTATIQMEASILGVSWIAEGAAMVNAGIVDLSGAWVYVRGRMTVYAAGAPTLALCGKLDA